MKKIKKIFIFIIVGILVMGLISCSSSDTVKQQTPEEFIKALFTEKDPNKFVNYISYISDVYDENGNIKSEKLDACLEFSEKVRTSLQEQYVNEGLSIKNNSSYSINVQGRGEIKVIGVGDGRDILDFYLEPYKNTYKFLVNATLGINDYTFIEFKSGNDYDKPTKFRVVATLDDFFNYSFRDKELEYYSINIKEPLSNEYFTAYVKKDSEDGKRLFELLKDGLEHNIIVKIHVPKNEKPSHLIVIIDNIISDSWLYPKDIE